VVEPFHDKAMPVLIRTRAEAEQWHEAPAEEALQLQRPAPDDAIVVVPESKKAA
jgi:putative SOS response-associated peptidase YedK